MTVWSTRAGRTPPPEGEPFALIERTGRGLVIAALNGPARALGLARGQAHADACAAVPGLVSAPAEPDQAARALRRLALWAERFSPAVAVDETPGLEGLSLDMTGAAHLFGGEAAMLVDFSARLASAGIEARCAMADTLGAAWAMARFSRQDEALIGPGAARAVLADLPVQALRIDAGAVKLLHRFGLKRVGDLYELPRAGLARRFRSEAGLAVVERLDQALGAAPEPVCPERPPPRYRAWRVFAEPLIDTPGIDHQLSELVERLCGQLDRDGQGARRVRLTAFRVDGRTTAIEAALSAPSAKPGHLGRLLRGKGLEHLDLGFGADALMLSALVVEAVNARQCEMEDERDALSADALAGLIDRLQARLGERAVRRPAPRQSWIPERAERWVRAGAAPPPSEALAEGRLRPILLFDPPEPVEAIAGTPDGTPARFTWRRMARRVARAEGPERLSPEWWRPEAGRTRDYYRVEDEEGRRYWLFRDGLFAREDADSPPRWWLHGVFA